MLHYRMLQCYHFVNNQRGEACCSYFADIHVTLSNSGYPFMNKRFVSYPFFAFSFSISFAKTLADIGLIEQHHQLCSMLFFKTKITYTSVVGQQDQQLRLRNTLMRLLADQQRLKRQHLDNIAS